MYDKYFKFISFLAPPTPIIVGSWSLVILIGCAYSIYCTKQVSGSVAVIFSAVLTNFTANKISKSWNTPQDCVPEQPVVPEKNLDVQGDK